MLKKLSILILMLFAFAIPVANAYYNPGDPTGYVNDFAQMMSDEGRAQLESELDAFEKETGHEIAVVTIESLQDDYIENFAVELFADWGIGKKGADNGVLFLIARDEREFRIEVGYGLEGALTDIQSKAILNQIATPYFKDADFDSGITLSVREIASAIKGEELHVSLDESGSSSFKGWGSMVFYGLIILFSIFASLFKYLGKSKSWWAGGVIGAVVGGIIGLILWSIMYSILGIAILGALGLLFDWGASHKGWFKNHGKGGRAGGIWFGGGGKGGGGGFGGFGGGFSGGGGASGRW